MIKYKDYEIVETGEEFREAVKNAVPGDTIYAVPDLPLKATTFNCLSKNGVLKEPVKIVSKVEVE